jgi:hypothetical protein
LAVSTFFNFPGEASNLSMIKQYCPL